MDKGLPVWEVLSLPIAGQASPHEAGSSHQDTLDFLLPKLTSISCECDAKDFTPHDLQRFIQSRRQDNLALAQLDACKLQKIRISLENHCSGFTPLAQKHQEDRQREFLEELTTELGVDVEGLQMDIEWPYSESSFDEAFLPSYGFEDVNFVDG
ncbi:hypothetical protein EST38_g8466 [Candolleomyces aberdarensis]|uniref:Uncharacterized protein n=1 Tax=Candolleomyces aberdarensis TaxID=2316362 RepID=A0A4Q2DCE3_9AGAR|nr:hypothetical protein EST38_g8466 [Candolleomyces aberdarensis]